MEQSNGNPKKQKIKITDKILIDFFKNRNSVYTNAERLNRIIPNYNRVFNRNIPNNSEGVIELRNILTQDYLEAMQQQVSTVAFQSERVEPFTENNKREEAKVRKEEARLRREEMKKQKELSRLLEIEAWNKQQLQKNRNELINSFKIIIKSGVDILQEYSFEEITQLYQYSITDFVELLLDLNPHTEALEDRIVILSVYAPNEINAEHYFLLSRTGANNLYEFIRGNNQYSKDSKEKINDIFINFTQGYRFKLENRQIIKRRQGIRKEGEFFNHLHRTEIDLTTCGIYNNNQYNKILEDGIDTYRYDLLANKGCLYYALFKHIELTGTSYFSNEDLNVVFTDIHRTSLKLETVKIVAKELKICIHLRYNDGLKNRIVKINEYEDYVVNIGFLADHYFLDYKTNNTLYSVLNYFELNNEKNYEYIYRKQTKGGYARDNTGKKFVNTYDIVEVFLKNKEIFLEDIPSIIEKNNEDTNKQTKATAITEEELKIAISKIDDEQLYNYMKDLAKREEALNKRVMKDKTLKEEWIEVSCDLETNTDKETNKIIPITSHYNLPNEEPRGFKGLDCVKNLLQKLPNNCILYFHNAKFDISHFQTYFTEILEYVENEGRFIYEKAKYFNKTFYIIDTMNYLTGSLKTLADDFKLKYGKELVNYSLYNEITKAHLDAGKWYRNIKHDYENYYNGDNEFLKNIEKWKLKKINIYVDAVNCVSSQTPVVGGHNPQEEYDALGYLYCYGLVDVSILQQLYNILTNSIFENFGVKMNFSYENGYKLYPTISSIAREFSKKVGCLEGVCSNKGVIREFIDGCMVGGRTMLKSNEKVIYNVISQTIIDYTSLYPSAMFRMGKYPLGKPSFIKSFDKVDENYYVVKIRIGKGGIQRKLRFPTISKIEKRYMMDIDGKMKNINTRCFTNDFNVGEEIIVDKYTLEDAVEFQGLDYELVYGLCWFDGYNHVIKNIVEMCFNKRIQLKKEGNNAGQTAYKLILNSLYGFTAEKPHLTKVNIVNDSDVMKYVLSHSKRVCCASKIIGGNKYIVKSSEDINKHFNYNHIATSILSYSKRLMNEVFVVAEDNNIQIEYTDTDSLFLKNEDLDLLNKKFVDKYNCEMINNTGALNTFKIDMSDFVIRDGDKYIKTNSKEQGISCEDLIGGEGIYLGKKTYLVEVKNKKDLNFTGYIFSSKGITDTSLYHYCNKKQHETGVNYGLKELFVDLSNNEYVEIDLCEGGNKYRVEYINTASFQKKNFTRRIGGFREIEFS